MEQVAFKGTWQDESTFVETVNNLYQIDSVIHTYTFEGKNVTIDVATSIGGYVFQMKGEMINE